jgi:hypothetical protein
MGKLFIGPLRHWLLFFAVLGVLWLMGANQFHTSNFKIFLLVLIGLAISMIAMVVIGYRKGEQITREMIDDT